MRLDHFNTTVIADHVAAGHKIRAIKYVREQAAERGCEVHLVLAKQFVDAVERLHRVKQQQRYHLIVINPERGEMYGQISDPSYVMKNQTKVEIERYTLLEDRIYIMVPVKVAD